MGRTYGSRRSRVRIDACAARANMCPSLHIQYRRPNDLTYRAPNWNNHSLGQWVELMGVGDHECASMRALRVQTCAQPCTSSIDGQTTKPIEPQNKANPKFVQKPIGAMGTSYGAGVRAARAAGNRGGAADPASAERENEREARDYRDGIVCSNCRECEVRVWGALRAYRAYTA
jgi:hypothetical protein